MSFSFQDSSNYNPFLKNNFESRNEYIKWPSGVLLLIKSCHSCTYSMRAIFRFLSWKSCHKSSRFWDEISQISSMRALLRFLSWKSCHKSSRFGDEISQISSMRALLSFLSWKSCHKSSQFWDEISFWSRWFHLCSTRISKVCLASPPIFGHLYDFLSWPSL